MHVGTTTFAIHLDEMDRLVKGEAITIDNLKSDKLKLVVRSGSITEFKNRWSEE